MDSTGSDSGLNIEITADSAEAVGAADASVAAYERLITALEANTAAMAAANDAEAAATITTKAHVAAKIEEVGAIELVTQATNESARVFGSLGLATGEATERIFALTEGFEALGKVGGPLLLIGGALITIGAAANFVAESIKDASKEQTEFVSISRAIKNSGGNWDEARESIETFTTALSRATIYSKGEAVQALDELISAGISYHDSEILVATATDVASARHRDLISVVDDLRNAELGRSRGLETLDVNLRKVVQTHGDMQQVLDVLNRDFAGAGADAVDTYAGAQARLRNELELLGTEIGTSLLPILETLTKALISGVRSVEDSISSVMEGAAALGHVRDAIAGNDGDIDKKKQTPFEAEFDIDPDLTTRKPRDNWKLAQEAYAKAQKANDASFADLQGGGPDVDAIFRKLRAEMGTALDSGKVGVSRGGGAGVSGPSEMAPIPLDALPTLGLKDSQEIYDEALKSISISEDAFKDKVELATTSASKQAAQLTLNAKIAQDARDAIEILNIAIADENSRLATATAQHDSASAAAERLAVQYDALWAATNKGTTASKEQRAELENLNREHGELEKVVNASASAISTLKSEIDRNTASERTWTQATQAAAIAQAKLVLTATTAMAAARQQAADASLYDGETLEQQKNTTDALLSDLVRRFSEGLVSEAAFWPRYNELYDRGIKENEDIASRDATNKIRDVARKQDLADELATYKQSLEYQVDYYLKRAAIDNQAGDTERAEGDYGKILDLDKQIGEERINIELDVVKHITDLESTLVDDVIGKHKSLRDSLKDVWKDILGDWTQLLENMVLKSSILSGLTSKIDSFFGIATGNGTSPSGAGGGSLLSSLISSNGGQQGVTVGINDDTKQALTGSVTGVSAGNGFASDAGQIDISGIGGGDFGGGGSTGGAGAAGAVAGLGGGAAGGFKIPGLKGGLATNVSGALAGFGYGETLNSLVGGNQTWGTVGSAVGAGVGIIGGPLGSAIGGSLGGLLGGLFGNHETAAQTPDTSDPTYHQTIDNYNGQGGLVQSQYSTGLGGTAEATSIEAWANSLKGQSGLSQSVQDAVNQVLGLEGGNANADLTTKSLHQGILTLGDGKTVSYADLKNIISTYTGDGGDGSGASSSVPIFNVARSYNDANLGTVSADGSFTPANTNTPGTNTSNGVTTSTPTVSVTINGNVVGPGGLSGIAQQIGVALRQVGTGQIPGSGYVLGTPGIGGRRRYTGG